MEWNLISEDDSDFLIDIDSKDAANDELEDELSSSLTRPLSARRTIEILREQKQLEADTWDYFE